MNVAGDVFGWPLCGQLFVQTPALDCSGAGQSGAEQVEKIFERKKAEAPGPQLRFQFQLLPEPGLRSVRHRGARSIRRTDANNIISKAAAADFDGELQGLAA
jgi:hypothetical protein